MKKLKKLSRENLKNLNGGRPLYPCFDIQDVSHCFSNYAECSLHSNNCRNNTIEFCGKILYCMY